MFPRTRRAPREPRCWFLRPPLGYQEEGRRRVWLVGSRFRIVQGLRLTSGTLIAAIWLVDISVPKIPSSRVPVFLTWSTLLRRNWPQRSPVLPAVRRLLLPGGLPPTGVERGTDGAAALLRRSVPMVYAVVADPGAVDTSGVPSYQLMALLGN